MTREATQLRQMGLEGIRALLDFRAEFGPEVELRSVKAGPGGRGVKVGHA